MTTPSTLPDSRLHDAGQSTVMVDWVLPSGGTVRIEVQPVYCASCGVLFGHVPKENTTFAFWLCCQCFEQYGAVVGTYAVPEEEFNQAVAHEMQERYGRHLSDWELFRELEQGRLGTSLELLARESPYKVANR